MGTERDPITPTGKDFVSIRGTGYVKPAFDEAYTFRIEVNDGARLWVDGDFVIDGYETVGEAGETYAVYDASTSGH